MKTERTVTFTEKESKVLLNEMKQLIKCYKDIITGKHTIGDRYRLKQLKSAYYKLSRKKHCN